MEFICKIAGQAGAGVMVTGKMLITCFTRGGYNVVGYPEYPSIVRGGHNTVQIRVSDKKINSPRRYQDVLIALNKDGFFYHMHEMSSGGTIIYDELIDISKFKIREDVKIYPLPLSKLTREVGGTEQMKNTASLGAVLALIDYPFEVFEQILKDQFGRKGEEIVKVNVDVAKAGYDFVKKSDYACGHKIKPLSDKRSLVITGNEAIPLGAIRAGMRFYAAYPMTPASSILHYLAKIERDFGLVVKQTEDEIAAVNYTIGAAYAGARAMLGTSGGGFALMTEALGLAALSETPIVMVLVQRTGPSTGMPTWTEQADLRFALHASQGDFPRIILAPGTVTEAFELGAKAHNLAEKYQLPVIIMSDKNLAESVFSTPEFDQEKIKIERGKIAEDLPELPPMTRYERYKLTKDGVSPRVFPGTPNGMHVGTSYEHDETGASTENFVMRTKQVQKRAKKLESAMKDMDPPEKIGPKDAEITLVGWGSTKLAAVDALPLLEEKGVKANYVHFTHLYPLDEDAVKKVLEGSKKLVMLENNYSAQFAGILKQYTGVDMDFHLLRYDGRSFFPEDIVEHITKLKESGFRGEKRITVIEKDNFEYYAPYRHGL